MYEVYFILQIVSCTDMYNHHLLFVTSVKWFNPTLPKLCVNKMCCPCFYREGTLSKKSIILLFYFLSISLSFFLSFILFLSLFFFLSKLSRKMPFKVDSMIFYDYLQIFTRNVIHLCLTSTEKILITWLTYIQNSYK